MNMSLTLKPVSQGPNAFHALPPLSCVCTCFGVSLVSWTIGADEDCCPFVAHNSMSCPFVRGVAAPCISTWHTRRLRSSSAQPGICEPSYDSANTYSIWCMFTWSYQHHTHAHMSSRITPPNITSSHHSSLHLLLYYIIYIYTAYGKKCSYSCN